MKIIPYIRFLIALSVFIGFLNRWMKTEEISQTPQLIVFILFGVIFLNFILYSILVGIQELKNRTLITVKTFLLTGFLIEIILLLGDLLGLFLIVQNNVMIWITIVMIIESVGLLVLIAFDAKKLMIK